MKKYAALISCAVLVVLPGMSTISAETPLPDITLPAPQIEGGKPLMEVLKARQSSREFSNKAIAPQMLSDLLWAAYGINRPDGKRTAPSTRNWQEIEVYAVTGEGAYLYDAKENKLKTVAAGDFRKTAGAQEFVATAPLNLVYVADFGKMKGSDEELTMYSAADVAFISQNVYLFCASEGLATVVRAWLNKDACAKMLKLSAKKKVVLAQTIGYPKEK